jgi:hypothetical protein
VPRVSHKITLTLGILVGSFFLWLAVRDVEWVLVVESLKAANHWLVLPILISLGLFYWFKAVRWSLLLLPSKSISARDLVPPMIIGFAGNNILPMRLGELLRVYVLGKEQRLSKSMVLATIVLERMFDAISILLLLTLAMTIASAFSPGLSTVRWLLLVLVVTAFVMAYGIVLAPQCLSNALSSMLGIVPERLRPSLVERFRHLQRGFAALRQKQALIRILLNSLAQWLLMTLCVYLAIEAFNVDVPPTAAVFVLALVVAGISLPSAPGFVGTIEYCFVLGLGFFGVAANEALGIGIFYHAITFVSVTLAGAMSLRRYGTSFHELRIQATKSKEVDS